MRPNGRYAYRSQICRTMSMTISGGEFDRLRVAIAMLTRRLTPTAAQELGRIQGRIRSGADIEGVRLVRDGPWRELACIRCLQSFYDRRAICRELSNFAVGHRPMPPWPGDKN